MSNVHHRSVEVVQNEHERTHGNLSAEQEHQERLNGTIDKRGRRLPAYYLELLILLTGMLLVGFYMLVIHPVW